jgi:hypothetical protein
VTVINRTQALVLGFFALAWVALITILVVAPEVYDLLGGPRPVRVRGDAEDMGVAATGLYHEKQYQR